MVNRVAAKKRNSSKSKKQGLSGNPQRRAQQLRAQQLRAGQGSPALATPFARSADPEASGDDMMRQLAYHLAGGANPAPWWGSSHDTVLERVLAADWPPDPVEAENLTCEIVGGTLWECFDTHTGGHQPAQWLVMLTEEAGAALRASAADGTEDWRKLWPLLCGITLTAPRTPAGKSGDRRLADMFPDIKQPHETAVAEAARCARALARQGLDFVSLAPAPDRACQVAGAPLVARDEYGSRFLLAVPFRYPDGTQDGPADSVADHWYAWDIDMCWLDMVTAAGVFGSPGEALAEWRNAVGDAAADASLEESSPELTARLLRTSLETGPFSDTLQGDEPRELIREYYRERRRARAVAESIEGEIPDEKPFTIDMDKAREEFLEWYAGRNGADSVSPGMNEAVDTITDHWGPHRDVDDAVFYACSPHRIEMSAHLIRSTNDEEHAEPAVRLMPEWTQWCIERRGLQGDAAARSRGAALTVLSVRRDAAGRFPNPADSAPFRRPE